MTTTTPQNFKTGLFSSVRNRLSLAFALATALPISLALVAVVFVAHSAVASNLTTSLGDRLVAASSVVTDALSTQINLLVTLSGNQALIDDLEVINNGYTGSQSDIDSLIAERDVAWRSSASGSTALVTVVLNHPISEELNNFRANFPAHGEIFITDIYGAVVATTGITSDYYQADEEWWTTAWNDGLGAAYIANEAELDTSAGIFGLSIAIPIRDYNDNGAVVGILRTTYDTSALTASLDDLSFVNTGHIFLVDQSGTNLLARVETTLTIPPSLLNVENPQADFIEDANGTRFAAIAKPLTTEGQLTALDQLGWHVAAVESEEEVFRSADQAVQFVMLAAVVVTVIALIIGLFISRWMTRPLESLTNGARRLQDGDLKSRVMLAGRDEFAELGGVLNAMAEQLEGVLSSLEDRIAARTRDFQTVAEVNRQISTLLNVDRLLHDVADLTKERFHLYHAHVYVVTEGSDTLVLAAGAGHVGRQMVSEVRTIALDNQQSIVARAAYSRKPVAVQDVTQSATFLPHPLLPDTKSELAVPLVARGQLLGVLDVQSDQVDYFTSEVIAVIELMAGQIATALSNASLYEVADRSSRHERALGNIDRHIQSAADMDEILQVTVRELGKALRAPHTAIELRLSTSENEYAVQTQQLNGESQ
jgi:GAF domain-containing protein/HAMP domain-containing protein